MRLLVVTLATLACLVAPAYATEVLNDNFDGYSDGPLPAPWSLHSGTAGEEPVVTSGEVEVAAARSADVNQALTGGPYGSGTTLFVGFTIRPTAVPTASEYIAHFKAGSTIFRGRIFMVAGGVADTVSFGISNGSASPDQTFARDVALGATVTIVVRIDQTGAEPASTLWVDPIDINSTSVSAADSSSIADVTQYALRQKTGIGSAVIDDLTVATTFAEVVPTGAGSLTVATDNPTPNPDTTTNDAQDLVIAGFTAAASGGDATLSQLDLSAGGNADLNADIITDGVTVYRDSNDNGSFDNGTDATVATGSFDVAGGLVLSSLSNNVVSDGTTVRFFVVYDLAGSASVGETMGVSLTMTADVTVTGDSPVTGRTIEIADAGAGGGGGNLGSGGGGCAASTATGTAWPALLLALMVGLVAIRRLR